MVKLYARLMAVMVLLFTGNMLFAQETELHQTMTSNNKIYVVMAVCLTILLGIIFYLIRIDSKIGKAEKSDL